MKENSKGSKGSRCKSCCSLTKEEQKTWKLMTSRGACPQRRLRSSPLWKRYVYDRSRKSEGDKETCQRERDSAILEKQPTFLKSEAAQVWFTNAAHHVRECRWIRPSWNWLLVKKRWSEMQLHRVFHYFSHLQMGLFPQNNRCIMCRIRLLRSGSWVLLLRRVHRASRAFAGSRLPKAATGQRGFIRAVFMGICPGAGCVVCDRHLFQCLYKS